MSKIKKFPLGLINMSNAIIPVSGNLNKVLDIQEINGCVYIIGEVDDKIASNNQFYVKMCQIDEEVPYNYHFKYYKTLIDKQGNAHLYYIWNPMESFDI